MKVFLDENFPLTLVHRLREDGHDAEHVITVGWRSASDERIAERLAEADLVFLTQDEDFLFSRGLAAVIVLSRVKQARPLAERIAIWRRVIRALMDDPPGQRRFELLDDGSVVPWDEGPQNSWVARPRRAL